MIHDSEESFCIKYLSKIGVHILFEIPFL